MTSNTKIYKSKHYRTTYCSSKCQRLQTLLSEHLGRTPKPTYVLYNLWKLQVRQEDKKNDTNSNHVKHKLCPFHIILYD